MNDGICGIVLTKGNAFHLCVTSRQKQLFESCCSLCYGINVFGSLNTALAQKLHQVRNLRHIETCFGKLFYVCKNLFARALAKNMRALKNDNVIGIARHILHTVANNQHGGTCFSLICADTVKNIVTSKRIKSCGRFIKYQHLRAHSNDSC